MRHCAPLPRICTTRAHSYLDERGLARVGWHSGACKWRSGSQLRPRRCFSRCGIGKFRRWSKRLRLYTARAVRPTRTPRSASQPSLNRLASRESRGPTRAEKRGPSARDLPSNICNTYVLHDRTFHARSTGNATRGHGWRRWRRHDMLALLSP